MRLSSHPAFPPALTRQGSEKGGGLWRVDASLGGSRVRGIPDSRQGQRGQGSRHDTLCLCSLLGFFFFFFFFPFLSHTSSHFALVILEMRVLRNCFPGLALNLGPPGLSLPSGWDYRYKPPVPSFLCPPLLDNPRVMTRD
jgi:hypothetical protein